MDLYTSCRSVSDKRYVQCRRLTNHPNLLQPLYIERQNTIMSDHYVLSMSRVGSFDRSVSIFASWHLNWV